MQRFAEINAFAPDPAWVVTANFRPAEQARTKHIVHTNSGREVDYRVVGTFAFTLDGHEVEMVRGVQIKAPSSRAAWTEHAPTSRDH